MTPELKVFASIAATGIAIFAYIPYLIDMFRGRNKPHLYTWISIVLVTTIVAYIQFVGGAGVGAIPTIIGDIIDVIILFYCFRFGTKDVIFMDKVCLALSVVGVVAYLVFQSQPFISLAIVSVAEVISFIPTFRKTRNDPYSESLTSYYLVLVKLVLILCALQMYNLLTTSYSLVWITVYIVFLTSVYSWRSRIKHHKIVHRNSFPEAT